MWSAIAPYLIGGGMNLAGSMLQSNAQGNLDEENRAHQIRTLMAQLGVDMEKFDRTMAQAQAENALTATQQTPNRVNWRQDQAMRAAVMPGLRNTSVSSPIAGMDAFIPQISGGLRIPEGGFGPDTMKFFGDNAMLQGEADLDRAGSIASGGRYATPNYGAIYGEPGRQAQTQLDTISGDLRRQDEEASVRQREALARALGAPGMSQGGAIRRPPQMMG